MTQAAERVASGQGQWSATAGTLKSAYETARRWVLVLTVLGALLAAIASQLPGGLSRECVAFVGAAALALSGLVSKRCLGPDKAARWARARGASEALKRLAYEYAAQAAPYDDPATRDALALAEVRKIEDDLADLLDDQQPASRGGAPTSLLAPADYIAKRVTGSAAWYEGKAVAHRATSLRWRRVELGLAVATALLTAFTGAFSGAALAPYTHGVDLAALVGVLTTLSGAILAHVEAGRYDYLVVSYRAAARRLRDEAAAAPANPTVPSPDWSAFVARCEAVVAEETGSWVARFSKPAG